MQRSLNQHVPQPLCCWWQCCFRAHTAMPGVFFSDLRKSKKCSTSHWECKWGWSFCSTTRDKLCSRWHNSPYKWNDSRGRTRTAVTGNLREGDSHGSEAGESILLQMARREFQRGQTAADSGYYSSSGEEMTLGTKTKASRNRTPGRPRRAQGNTTERKELSRRMLSGEQYRSPQVWVMESQTQRWGIRKGREARPGNSWGMCWERWGEPENNGEQGLKACGEEDTGEWRWSHKGEESENNMCNPEEGKEIQTQRNQGGMAGRGQGTFPGGITESENGLGQKGP